MKEKRYSISVLGNKDVVQEKNVDFYSTDTDAWLKLKLTDNGLNPKKAIINLYNVDDTSIVSESVEIENKEVTYYLRPEIIEHAGNWIVQLIFIDDKEYTSGRISFRVKAHLTDEVEAPIEIIESWNVFMRHARKFLDEIDEQVGDLEETYAPRLNQLENTKADKLYVDEKDNELAAQLTKTDNVVDVYVSPENFNSLGDCVEYARENRKYIKADTVKLENHVSFRGVGVEIKELIINGFSIELGDYNVSPNEIVEGTKPYRPKQTIDTIYGRNGWNSEVYVRGASYQTISIGSYSGNVQIKLNDFLDENDELSSRFVAYNEFFFRNVRGVHISKDNGATDSNGNLWCNENDFYLGNTMEFIMGDETGYKHNMNRIHAGTFEGNSKIEIVNGRSNYFYGIRGEGNLNIVFKKEARNNIVEMGHYTYLPTVYDELGQNTVLGSDERNMRLIHQHSISTNHEIGGNESGYNTDIISPFKNLSFDVEKRGYKQRIREEGVGNNIFYVSPYISNPKNARMLVESHVVKGNLGVGYKYYDKDYKDITYKLATEGFTGYMITTTERMLSNNINTGDYRGPSSEFTLYSNGVELNLIKNDIFNLQASGHWFPQNHTESTSEIKYVKFFIGNLVNDAELLFYDLNISIYDVFGNYHKRYFNNYANDIDNLL